MNFSKLLNNKSFCPMPWVHIASHSDGSIRLCCMSNRFIKNDQGEHFNLGTSNIVDIFNSTDYQNIRKDMIAGNYIEGCETCYNVEKYSKQSQRNLFINKWLHEKSFRKKLEQTFNDQKLNPTIEFFDFRFGNLCNLSCRYCYSSVSTTYNKEASNINTIFNDKIFVTTNQDFNSWYETEVFNKNIYEQIPHLKKYYAAGGEPTLIDKNFELMSYMVEHGYSKNIELQISTNLTNTKNDFYSLLPYFKKVMFLASIDGTKNIQEYMRYPSSWDQIEKNLLKVIDMNIPSIVIHITPVVQKINLEFLTDICEYAENINRQYKKSIVNVYPILLSDPEYYDFTYLPTDYKINCFNILENWVNTKNVYQKQLYNKLEELRSKCFLDIDYKDNLRQFFKYNDIVDNHRERYLRDVNPNLDKMRDK